MIHICYGLYDKDGHYSKFVGTSMASVFENTNNEITVHILHDNTLTTNNRDKLNYVAGKYNQQIKFYNVEILAKDNIENFKANLSSVLQSQFSIATLYRLLIPNVISNEVTRIIYLDADIIVNLDIKELWQTDVKNRPMATVSEVLIHAALSIQLKKYLIDIGRVKAEDYFNAGVLLINLDYWRNHINLINEGYKFVCEHPECEFFDQDILNYCFATDSVKLALKFDTFIIVERLTNKSPKINRAIYHYTSDTIKLNLNDCFNQLYFSYFVKTPWFNTSAFRGIFKAFDDIQKAQQNASLSVIRLLGKRDRAFFTERQNIPAVRALFEITDKELVIDASNSDALMKIINALRDPNSKRKKVFFIFSGNYLAFKNFLVSQKFVEGIDFVNATPLVSGLLGIPMESHSLVRAM